MKQKSYILKAGKIFFALACISIIAVKAEGQSNCIMQNSYELINRTNIDSLMLKNSSLTDSIVDICYKFQSCDLTCNSFRDSIGYWIYRGDIIATRDYKLNEIILLFGIPNRIEISQMGDLRIIYYCCTCRSDFREKMLNGQASYLDNYLTFHFDLSGNPRGVNYTP